MALDGEDHGRDASDGPKPPEEAPRDSPALTVLSSIRARLLVLILLGAAALIGITVYFELDRRQGDEARAREELTRQSQFVAQNQSRSLETTRVFLRGVSELTEIESVVANPESPAARSGCTRALQATAGALPGAIGFGLVDERGDRICSSLSTERGGSNFAHRIDFQQALQSKEFAVGEVVETPEDPPQQTITVSLPILDGTDNVVAVLRFGVELGTAPPLPPPTNVHSDAEFSIIDRNGVVINSSGREPGSKIAIAPARLGAAAFFSTSVFSDNSGDATVQHFVTRATNDGQLPIYAVVSVPPGALTTPLAEALFPELLIVTAFALLAVIAAWFFGEYAITRPARALATAAARIRAGDLADPRDLPVDRSELGQVGIAFEDMTRRLREQLEQLQQALRSKDEFLSLVSHELRTPVTTILGNAHVLVSRWDALDEADRAVAMHDVHDEAQRLRTIIENLLVLARLETGRTLEVEPVMLARSLTTIVEAHRRKYPGRVYRLMLPADLPLVSANEQCIEQIMANLLNNAEKYSPADAPISIAVSSQSDQVGIAVEDSGIGLDPEEIEQLFTPFYRSTRTGQSAGIGIGLTVCRRLVEAQGGRMWAQPGNGQGAVFAFSLPLVEGVAEPSEPLDQSQPDEAAELAPA